MVLFFRSYVSFRRRSPSKRCASPLHQCPGSSRKILEKIRAIESFIRSKWWVFLSYLAGQLKEKLRQQGRLIDMTIWVMNGSPLAITHPCPPSSISPSAIRWLCRGKITETDTVQQGDQIEIALVADGCHQDICQSIANDDGGCPNWGRACWGGKNRSLFKTL